MEDAKPLEADPSEQAECSYANVRCGAMGHVIKCSSQTPGLRANDPVVVRTERGVESGSVVCQCVTCGGAELPGETAGEILRRMTPEDLAALDEIERVNQPTEFAYCLERIAERDLPMKLVYVEHLFGGAKIVFYFVADGRVDFRQLVKDLAQEYRCRIEMRQIGVRDEARLLADYEHCGRPLCCRTFVKKLEPVSMKMAKSQKATLDPSKISGRCGRLMCCLRFEDDVYEELKRSLPRKGTRVNTPEGPGTVADQEVMLQSVVVDLGEGKRATFGADQVQRGPSGKQGGAKRDKRQEPSGAQPGKPDPERNGR